MSVVPDRQVAEEVRSLRLKAGHTQVSLARVLGVSRRTISRWEAARGGVHKVWLRRMRQLSQNVPEVTTHAQ